MAIFEEISSFDNLWVPDEVITSWASRDPSPVNNQVVIFEPTDGIRWQLQYDSTADQWEFIGGGHWTQYAYASISTTSTTYVTLTGEPITFPSLPAGTYNIGHGFIGTVNAAGVWHTGTVNGGQPEASQQSPVANYYMGVSAHGEYFIALTTTIGPQYRTSSNTAWFARRWMTITPKHLLG